LSLLLIHPGLGPRADRRARADVGADRGLPPPTRRARV